jgi:hypothetical protein
MNKKKEASLPKDPVAQLYLASLATVGVYIIYRLMNKVK